MTPLNTGRLCWKYSVLGCHELSCPCCFFSGLGGGEIFSNIQLECEESSILKLRPHVFFCLCDHLNHKEFRTGASGPKARAFSEPRVLGRTPTAHQPGIRHMYKCANRSLSEASMMRADARNVNIQMRLTYPIPAHPCPPIHHACTCKDR